LYGTKVTVIDGIQAGFLIIQLAKAMAWNMPGKHFNTKFRNAVMKCAALTNATTDPAYLDPVSDMVLRNRVGRVNLQIGLAGPVLDKNQDPVELFQIASAAIPTLGGPQGEADILLSAICEQDEDSLYVRSKKIGKLYKRLMLSLQRQMNLVDGFDAAKMLYKGKELHGREFSLLYAPDLPAIFTGADGSLLATQPAEVIGNKSAFYVDKTFADVCYKIPSGGENAVKESLPQVGEILGEQIKALGMVVPYEIDKRFVGAQVTSVEVSAVDEYGHANWQITARRVERFGQIKGRNGSKAIWTYTRVVPGPDTLHTAGVAIGRSNGKDLSEIDGIVGAGGLKILGSGCADGRVSSACQTLPEHLVRALVPAETLHEGRVNYNEKADFEGAYDKLVDALNSTNEQVWVESCSFDEHTYSQYRSLYTDLVYTGQEEEISISLGTNMFGGENRIEFRHQAGVFSCKFTTNAIAVKEIIKVESTSVSQNCTYSSCMLEVATFAYSVGLKETARELVEGGDRAVEGVERTLKLLSYVPSSEHKVVWTFESSNALPANAAALRWLLDNPIPLWPDNVVVAMTTKNGNLFAVDKKVLEGFIGTDARHVVRTVLSCIAFAAKGDYKESLSAATGLFAGLSSICGSTGFHKRVNRGSASVVAKRMPIIMPGGGGYHTVYVNRAGNWNAMVAKLFGVKDYQTRGRMGVLQRAPMFMGCPVRIEFCDWIPVDMIGVTPELASFLEGDFDGDADFFTPIKRAESERELERFNARKVKAQIHKMSVRKNEHLLTTTAYERQEWARASRVSVKEMMDICSRSQEHQIRMMPTDGNRSDIGMYLAAMGCADPLMAAGFKLFVFESELGGYDPDWYEFHKFVQSGAEPEHLVAAGMSLGLTREMTEFWIHLIQAYAVGKKYSRFTRGNDKFCRVKADSLSHVRYILASAFKAMAQGKGRPADAFGVFPNLGRTVVLAEGKEISLWAEVCRLADMGMPAAVRARQCMLRIQPLVQALGSKVEAENSDEEGYDFE
jgi:hypothetical protein